MYVEIGKREKVLEEPVPLMVDFPEYAIPVKRVLGMDLNEVGSEKISAILTRNKSGVIFDLYYLISSKRISFKRELVDAKLEFYGVKFSRDLFTREVKSRTQRLAKDLKGLVFAKIPEYEYVVDTFENWVPEDGT